MKTRKEVENLIGVTRKTLRGYDEEGLLSPTIKKPQWKYDDEAIRKLAFIQVFVEVGYSRKKIKSILDSTEKNFEAVLDEVLVELNRKKERINGMINSVKSMKSISKLPISILESLAKADVDKVYGVDGFSEALRAEFNVYSSFNEDEAEFMQMLSPLIISVQSIAFLKDEGLESKKVINCFNGFVSVFWEFLNKICDQYDDDFVDELLGKTDDEFANDMSKAFINMLDSMDIHEVLETRCGPGSYDFVKQVFQKYKLKKPAMRKDDNNGQLQ